MPKRQQTVKAESILLGYAIVGPYSAEVWPTRLRASGMGAAYGVGGLGKIIGPLGLALIVGSADVISPKATLDGLFPAMLYLSSWYLVAGCAFLFLGFETKGRSIEQIDRTFPATPPVAAAAAKAPAV